MSGLQSRPWWRSCGGSHSSPSGRSLSPRSTVHGNGRGSSFNSDYGSYNSRVDLLLIASPSSVWIVDVGSMKRQENESHAAVENNEVLLPTDLFTQRWSQLFRDLFCADTLKIGTPSPFLCPSHPNSTNRLFSVQVRQDANAFPDQHATPARAATERDTGQCAECPMSRFARD